jgi:uncharacterized protein (TIGR00255 family)
MVMNIQSMTGYGAGEANGFRVEVRSTNHKNLHIQLNLPAFLIPYETEIRAKIKEKIQRGVIEVFFNWVKPDVMMRLSLNKELAGEYYRELLSLKKEFSLSDDIGIDVIAQQKDIFRIKESEIDITLFNKALKDALEEVVNTRKNEGESIVRDILMRIESLDSLLQLMKEKRMIFVESARNNLEKRIKEVLGDVNVDESRLLQEVAFVVERSDINEEIVKIQSHLGHMKDVIGKGGSVGKKIGFIAQEIYRELNTIGSKSSIIELSALVVDMKYELEKIREQIQNLQ